MPVRSFDGVDDIITTALGSLNFAFGPGTIAVIFRKSSDPATNQAVVWVGSGISGARFALMTNSASNLLRLRIGTQEGSAPAGMTVAAADGWVLIALTKASGSVEPRWHRFVFATSGWTHQDQGAVLANSTAPTTGARFGANNTPANFFHGDIGIAGISNTVMSDADLELLTVDEAAWDAAPFVAKWTFDQASTATALPDDVGTAEQSAITGTSVTLTDIPWGGSLSSGDDALQGMATASGIILPGARSSVSPGVAPASGITPTAGVTNAILGGAHAIALGIAPLAGAHVTPEIVVASGIPPTASPGTEPGTGQAVAQGIDPTVTATSDRGVVVAFGVEPGAAATVEPGAFVAAGQPASTTAGVSPGVAITVGTAPTPVIFQPIGPPGDAEAGGIRPVASVPAAVAVATGSVTPPTARTHVSLHAIPATGVGPASAAHAGVGLALAQGVTTGDVVRIVFPTHSSGHKPGGRGGSLGGVGEGDIQQPIRGSAR